MSQVLVIGAGFVGTELGRRLRAAGSRAIGTTTTEAKVEPLRDAFDDVRLLRGAEADKVAAALSGTDAIVVAAGPAAHRSMSVEDRARTYREVLADTATGVTIAAKQAGFTGRVVVLSSLSVYGDAADGLDEIGEDAPTTTSTDPSPANFLAMERIYREALGDRVCIFRCADIYGGEDPPIEVKVKLAHEVLGGSVPFKGESLFYRIAVEDVIRAVEHALQHELSGTYNLTHAEVPATNRDRFDSIGAGMGLPPLQFRDEIPSPSKPISTAALQASGFATQHTRVER
jgi:nucleoside-diphosphate-sugar epimerase